MNAIDSLVRALAARATYRKVTALRGHDWEPGLDPLHFSTCPCGMGGRVISHRKDWAALAAHPIPR